MKIPASISNMIRVALLGLLMRFGRYLLRRMMDSAMRSGSAQTGRSVEKSARQSGVNIAAHHEDSGLVIDGEARRVTSNPQNR